METKLDGVERRRAHAVVRRKSDDDDALDVALSEETLEVRRDRFAGRGVAHREARIAVLTVRALLHARPDNMEARVEVGTPGVLHAVHGPDPAVLLEVGRGLGMPIL